MSKSDNYMLKLSIVVQEYKKDIAKVLLDSEDGLSEKELRKKFSDEILFNYHFGDMLRYGVVTKKPPYKLKFNKQAKERLKKVLI